MTLVTGGAGYIGCILVPLLVSVGYKVRVFDNFFFGQDYLKSLRGKIEKVKGDICKINEKVLEGVNSVIHLAALSNDPMADFAPKLSFAINTKATEKLVKLAKEKGVRRFIFASSCSLYDREDLSLNKVKLSDEETPLKQTTYYYSLSKLQAEKTVLKAGDKNFCPVVLRKGTVFGFSPRMRYDLVVNAMVKDALTSEKIKVFYRGGEWRPLIDVTDVARAYLLGLEAPEKKVKGEIFNLSFANFKIKDLALQVKKALGKKQVEIVNAKPNKKGRSYKACAQKIEKVLGFKAKVSVRQSVKHMVEKIYREGKDDFENPVYYNIEWMKKAWKEGVGINSCLSAMQSIALAGGTRNL